MPAKTTAKTKKAVTKAQTPEELSAALSAKQNDLLDYKKSLAAGELANPRIITVTRREIARLKTALTAAAQTGKGEK